MSAFTMQMDRAIIEKMGKVSTIARRSALECFSRVIQKTPVDTGTARNNWFANIGSPGTQMTESSDKSGASRISEAASATAEWNPESGEHIHLTNNLPYIERLENGWSKQAPAGMVGITIAEFSGIVQGAK